MQETWYAERSIAQSHVRWLNVSVFSSSWVSGLDHRAAINENHTYLWSYFFTDGKVNKRRSDTGAPDENETLNMGHVLKALIGCRRIPTNLKQRGGKIYFKHDLNDQLSFVHTCTPSIFFCSVEKIQEYKVFKEHMLHIIKLWILWYTLKLYFSVLSFNMTSVLKSRIEHLQLSQDVICNK